MAVWRSAKLRCGTTGLAPAMGGHDEAEKTWAFVAAGRVGGVNNWQVKALATLATNDRYRSYCGRTGDNLLSCLSWPDGPGSLTTCTKNSSIWRTAFMNWSKSTGLVS